MLEDLVGHPRVKRQLMSMLEHQILPHAFLFYGQEGVGKTSFAEAFASELIHSKKKSHPDIRWYATDEKSGLHTISAIRGLKEEVYLPPFEAKYKIFIIKDAHKMLPAASHAFLKTLEEPSSYCKIILLAPSLGDLLSTVVSRCCKVGFSPLQQEEIALFLIKEKQIEKETADKAALLAFGSLERALSCIDEKKRQWQAILLEVFLTFKKLPFDVFQDKLSCLEVELEMHSYSAEYLYELLLRCIRDLMVIKHNLDPNLLFFRDKEASFREAAQQIFLSFDAMQKIWQEAQESLTHHVKLKTGLEFLLIKLYEQHAGV